MKVLLVTEDFPPMPGGVARFLHNLCIYSQAQIRVLTTEMEHSSTNEFDSHQLYSINRIYLPAHLGFLSLLIRGYLLASTFRPDVIFWGHATSVAIAGRLLKAWLGKSLVILVHGTEMNISLHSGWLSRRMVLSGLRGADLVFVNSRDTGQNVCKLKVSADKISILNPGVDVEKFHPNVDMSDVFQRYRLAGRRVILTVSRLVPKKNHAAVLRALPSVLAHVPNVMYLIVGDGPERANLLRITEALGLRQHVTIIPYTTGQNLVKLYNVCDLFLMVSRTMSIRELPGAPEDVESFGIAFVEAGACGKPVIGGNSGGVPDAIVDGETGLLVDPEDEKATAGAIIRLLTDEAMRRRLGENGRRRAVKELSWEKVADRFDNTLTTYLSSRRYTPGR